MFLKIIQHVEWVKPSSQEIALNLIPWSLDPITRDRVLGETSHKGGRGVLDVLGIFIYKRFKKKHVKNRVLFPFLSESRRLMATHPRPISRNTNLVSLEQNT
jgi:hypothetical protein